jgi:hypothetical protein
MVMEAQSLQQWLLESIEKANIVPDSADLSMDGTPINQLELLGVLNGLSSREVLFHI